MAPTTASIPITIRHQDQSNSTYDEDETTECRKEKVRLTLLSDDSVDGTLGVLLGLGSLDLGFSLVVPLLSVLGQDARLGGSSDGLELRA